MKNKKISAILFAVLFAVQLLFMSYIFTNAAVTNIPVAMFVELAAVVVFGLVSAKLFTGEEVCFAKSAVLTVFYIAFNIVCYSTEAVLASTALSLVSQELSANTAVAAGIVIVRLVLLAAAVFFCGKKEKEPMNEEEIEVVEIIAEETPAAE